MHARAQREPQGQCLNPPSLPRSLALSLSLARALSLSLSLALALSLSRSLALSLSRSLALSLSRTRTRARAHTNAHTHGHHHHHQRDRDTEAERASREALSRCSHSGHRPIDDVQREQHVARRITRAVDPHLPTVYVAHSTPVYRGLPLWPPNDRRGMTAEMTAKMSFDHWRFRGVFVGRRIVSARAMVFCGN
jgi:hypothetical protein